MFVGGRGWPRLFAHVRIVTPSTYPRLAGYPQHQRPRTAPTSGTLPKAKASLRKKRGPSQNLISSLHGSSAVKKSHVAELQRRTSLSARILEFAATNKHHFCYRMSFLDLWCCVTAPRLQGRCSVGRPGDGRVRTRLFAHVRVRARSTPCRFATASMTSNCTGIRIFRNSKKHRTAKWRTPRGSSKKLNDGSEGCTSRLEKRHHRH